MNTATATRPLTHAELNETLSAVRIPPCPSIVAEVLREAQRDEPSMKVLSRIVASDVSMSAAAVKLANSPMFSPGSRVRSVQQAVNRLGINHILSVVVAVALRNTSSHLPADVMERFWSRASTLALAAGVLARGHVGISPDAAYTFALFQDAAVPVLHGKNGEDGTVQGLFELAGVPVIGCGTLSSALCMDKDRAHQLAALAGIRVPRSHVFHSSDDFSRIAQAAEELGYPVFVKPVRAGSSFGITKVSGPEELPAAMEEAFRHDSAVILEETIPGFEVGCAVMGNEELTVGLVDEIALSEGFFNYEEKYTLKTSAIHCPARIPPEKAAEIQAAAKTIYRALDCRVFARVDLFLTPDGEIVFNEVNTIPGFTAHSRYPSMMQGIGISFGELVTRLIELGVAG